MGKKPLGARRAMSLLTMLALSMLTAVAPPAAANTMRCGRAVLSVGDHQIEVLKECGEPTTVERFPAQLVPGTTVFGQRFFAPLASPLNPVSVEVWTYNFGPRRLIRQVRLEGGQVSEIRTLGYGF